MYLRTQVNRNYGCTILLILMSYDQLSYINIMYQIIRDKKPKHDKMFGNGRAC